MVSVHDWIGRGEVCDDVVTPAILDRFTATMDGASTGGSVGAGNPLVAWTLCTPAVAQSRLGLDGHPERGDFLPPVDLPRRMWAGSQLRFLRPLSPGAHVTRESTVQSVIEKKGASGRLVFVTVQHRIIGDGVLLEERQDIVYREAQSRNASQPSSESDDPSRVQWSEVVRPTSTLLQRYSAITFNAHRIHYDRGYAVDVEGYPGLVVHGPLVASLLMDLYLVRHPGADVKGFEFRAVAPLFDDAPFTLAGWPTKSGAELRAIGPRGNVSMKARVEL